MSWITNYKLLMPSLKYRVLVKIAILLWNEDDEASNFDFVSSFVYNDKKNSKWRRIENEVAKKVLKLTLPSSLEQELTSYVKVIGWQILLWKSHHKNFLHDRIKTINIDQLCWTENGTIDKEKTAKMLVQNQDLCIVIRYKLACIYCLDDEVFSLRKELDRDHFNEKNLMKFGLDQSPLVLFWSNYVERRKPKMKVYLHAFLESTDIGNVMATRYFLQKLSSKEKKKILMETTFNITRKVSFFSGFFQSPIEYYIDLARFLLTQITYEQQMAIIEIYPFEILNWFLQWPWQCYFTEVLQHMWSFLSKYDYHNLLRVIINKITDGFNEYDYHKLFRIVWEKIPDTHKRFIIRNYESDRIPILNLFKIGDIETVKLIFEDATSEEKENIICGIGTCVCEDLINKNKWTFIEFIIRECIPTKNEMIKFKNDFKKHSIWCISREMFAKIEDKFDNFFLLLDNLIEEFDTKNDVKKDLDFSQETS